MPGAAETGGDGETRAMGAAKSGDQEAASHLTRRLFGAMVGRIAALPLRMSAGGR